jgi:hypothetical protein
LKQTLLFGQAIPWRFAAQRRVNRDGSPMNLERSLAALRFIVECEPDLAWNGYRAGFDDVGDFEKARAEWFSTYKVEQFRHAINFLALVPPVRRNKIKARCSYALKHSAEVWARNQRNPDRVQNGGNSYVSNGALIAAAIYQDFPVEPIPRTFNAMIGNARGRSFDWPLVQTAEVVASITGPSIYFISAGDGLVKIGYSRNVDKRMRVLSTASPRPLQILLTIPGTRSDESAFHEMFKAERIRGEWFLLSSRIEDFIANGDAFLT